VAEVRRGDAGGCGVAGMTGPIEEYLRQLRAGLRTRPEETSRILAEAEDHLHESMAAGLAAGLTETEAAEAAISSFGSVRAVVRAHQARRGRAAEAWHGLVMWIWLLAGTALTSVFAVGLVMLVVIVATGSHGGRPPAGAPSPGGLARFVVACGLLGLAMLGTYSRARRLFSRSGR
jgi:HAAS domain-containing protein